jgi:hypothetical protein
VQSPTIVAFTVTRIYRDPSKGLGKLASNAICDSAKWVDWDRSKVMNALTNPKRNRSHAVLHQHGVIELGPASSCLKTILSVRYLASSDGGRGGIRTHGGLAPTAVFKTAALNHSATLPRRISEFRVRNPLRYGLSRAPWPETSTCTRVAAIVRINIAGHGRGVGQLSGTLRPQKHAMKQCYRTGLTKLDHLSLC